MLLATDRIQQDLARHLPHVFRPLHPRRCPLLETEQSSICPMIRRLNLALLRQRVPDRHYIRHGGLNGIHALLQSVCQIESIENEVVSSFNIFIITFETTIGFCDAINQVPEGAAHAVCQTAIGGQRVDFVKHTDHVVLEARAVADCEGYAVVIYSGCSVAGEEIISVMDKIGDGLAGVSLE